MPKTPAKRRGRPVEADADKIAAVALRLFEKKGFDNVTMDEVAHAAAVSRRTLFRLFPSKADLAWAGLGEVLVLASEQLASLKQRSADGILNHVIAPVLTRFSSKATMPLARRRLRIITASPALYQHPSLQAMQKQLAEVLGRGRATPKAMLAAQGIVAVSFGAMLWWALHGEEMTPVEAVREAFAALRA